MVAMSADELDNNLIVFELHQTYRALCSWTVVLADTPAARHAFTGTLSASLLKRWCSLFCGRIITGATKAG